MTTLRISGIPNTTQKHEISKAVHARGDCISLARNDTTSGSPLTATITFKTKRAADKFKAQTKHPRCLGKRPPIDSEFLGLTVLSSSNDDEVDLVAVHGLNGHAFDTWASGDRMWLRDFLPDQLPRVRIMTYGYNSNLFDKYSTTTIPEFAQGLLGALLNKRGPKDRKRPMIFVCHSLGGIVVKLALNIARLDRRSVGLSSATRGIVFLATPHRGSETASNALLGIAGFAAKALGVRQDLVLALRMDSRQLNEIDNDFRMHHGELETASFYETKKTKFSRIVSSFDRVIVERASAMLNAAKGPHFPIERDHREICKFACRHDDDYKAVYTQIAKLVKRAKIGKAARIVFKALHMPQLSSMFRGGGESLVRRYGEAWAEDCGSMKETR